MTLDVTPLELSIIGIALAALVDGEMPPVDASERAIMRRIAYDLHQRYAPLAKEATP